MHASNGPAGSGGGYRGRLQILTIRRLTNYERQFAQRWTWQRCFSALGIALLTFLLQKRAEGAAAPTDGWAAASLLLIGAGTLLYLATLLAYDRLLMPARYWAGKLPPQDSWAVRRPPSSAAWVLYQNMMHAWRWLFLPACGLVFAGLVALGIAPAARDRSAQWALFVALGTIVISLLWCWLQRPRLGAED